MLGPSAFSSHLPASTPQHMMGPLGLLAPAPGVSYLFGGANADEVGAGEPGSLWNIVHAGGQHGYVGLGSAYGGGLGSPPGAWTQALGDMVMKVDAKIKVCYSSSDNHLSQDANCMSVEDYIVATERSGRVCEERNQGRVGELRSIAEKYG